MIREDSHMTVTMEYARRADYPEGKSIHVDEYRKSKHGKAICAILGCNCELKLVRAHPFGEGIRAAHFARKSSKDRHSPDCEFKNPSSRRGSSKKARQIETFDSKSWPLDGTATDKQTEVRINILMEAAPAKPRSHDDERPGGGNPDPSAPGKTHAPATSSSKDYLTDARAVRSYVHRTLKDPSFSHRVKLVYRNQQMELTDFFVDSTPEAIGGLWDRLRRRPRRTQHPPVAVVFEVFREFEVKQRKIHKPGFWSVAGLYADCNNDKSTNNRIQLWILTPHHEWAEGIHTNGRNLIWAKPELGQKRRTRFHTYLDIHLHVFSDHQFCRWP